MLAGHIKLIVGLGNPGIKYANTRHNVGFWFIDEMLKSYSVSLAYNKKFHGDLARIDIGGKAVHVLCPTTFMNNSGTAVAAFRDFYNIDSTQILIVYDDLELAVGKMKLKDAGGHSGHNGVADIMQALGKKNFKRLRIGIGRPHNNAMEVTNYVLGVMSDIDKHATMSNIALALESLVDIVTLPWQVAVQTLHRKMLD